MGTPDPIAMVKECADWDAQYFPLAGGDVINMMVRFGLISIEDAKAAYIEVPKKHGYENITAPAYHATDPDDVIPF